MVNSEDRQAAGLSDPAADFSEIPDDEQASRTGVLSAALSIVCLTRFST
jgi:hypothetical protein